MSLLDVEQHNDEGFIEQPFKLPSFMKDWTDEQKAGFIFYFIFILLF